MDTVSLTFRYSEKDFVRAMRAHYSSRLRLPLDIAVVVGCLALGAYAWHSGSPRSGIAMICISGVSACMLIAAFAVIPHLAFRREPKFRDEYSLTFSPLGIHFRTKHIDSNLEWNMYSRALIETHSIVLYYGSNSFTVIPTRVFTTPEERERFDELLEQHVPKVQNKRKRL